MLGEWYLPPGKCQVILPIKKGTFPFPTTLFSPLRRGFPKPHLCKQITRTPLNLPGPQIRRSEACEPGFCRLGREVRTCNPALRKRSCRPGGLRYAVVVGSAHLSVRPIVPVRSRLMCQSRPRMSRRGGVPGVFSKSRHFRSGRNGRSCRFRAAGPQNRGAEFSKDGDCFSHETKNRSRNAWPCAGGMRLVALVVASCSLAWAAHRHGAGAFDQRHDQSGHRRSGDRASDTA